MKNKYDSYITQIASGCILLSVARADEIIEEKELNTICDILCDFFSISKTEALKILTESKKKLNNSIDLFGFGQHLNETFDHSDKLDFIGCIFEIAYSDGALHYLEHHTIKKIANILNLSRKEIINSKQEIENFYK